MRRLSIGSCEILKRAKRKTIVKRLRKILKIGALCLGVLLVIWLIGNAIMIRVTGNWLEERLAAIRAAGDPITLADLRKAPPLPEQNAAVVLGEGKDRASALMKVLDEIDFVKDAAVPPPSNSQQKALHDAFAAHPNVIPILRKASHCPEYDPNIEYVVGPQGIDRILEEVQLFREYANVLYYNAMLLRSQGDRGEAVENCLAILRLSRFLARGPTLMRYLVVVAMRSVATGELNWDLRSGQISPAQHAELDRELALCSDPREFEQALKGERAYGISTFATADFVRWPNRWLFNNDECCYLDQIHEHIDLVTKPYSDLEASEDKQRLGFGFHPMTTLFIPALMKTRTARDRSLALVRCLRVLNAIEAQGPWNGKIPEVSKLGLPG
jgi:hypothetical protein